MDENKKTNKQINLDLNDYQGKAQGCISGISSFANVVSPFVFSPLTGNSLKFAIYSVMQQLEMLRLTKFRCFQLCFYLKTLHFISLDLASCALHLLR